MSSHRLDGNGSLDRDRRLSFIFDGKRFGGYGGDTLASALLASGQKLLARSFKYHRPRGLLTAGSDEPNALVELRSGARREPNTRATVAELFDGLEARSQNRWPSLGLDLGAVNSWLSPLFVAGFYYKTFMWPSALWEKLYEPVIRRAAGLGRASMEADPDTYEKAQAFCDVLVIGGGPAGLAATLNAGRCGARVILCDEDFVIGGRLNGDRHEIDGHAASAWARRLEAELLSLPEVRIMRRTTVFGAYDGHTFGALERVADHLPVPPLNQPRQRLWRIVAKRIVLATGAIERPLVFANNDRPGVMNASAMRTYVNRFRAAPGRRAAVFTTCDDGWKTVFDLLDAGVEIAAVVDSREAVTPGLLTRAKQRDLRILLGSQVIGTRGTRALESISIRDSRARVSHLTVDSLGMSGGWNPSMSIATHLGGRPRWSDDIQAFIAPEGLERMTVVGAAAGDYSLAGALSGGATAGSEAARAAGFHPPALETWRTDDELVSAKPLWFVADSHGKAFVDFQHDVTRDDVALAAREGFRSVELLKRYTTLGMATDQGKTSNINGHAIMAALTERAIPEVGTTVSRPPYTPVALAAFAGHHRGKDFRPVRRTPSHDWAERRGAVFVEAGQWLRAQWFAAPGETDWLTSVTREVSAVRSGVGVCDVSTLGKIDVQGPDAGTFLDRLYANVMSTVAVGKVRYGLMLREDGCVMDDGTAARFDTDHYVVSTTTVNAAKVMQHMEHARQVLWPALDVQIVSATEQWAQYAIAGPRSRALLERLLGPIDLSDTAFPYLGCREISWNGLPARLFRISFSGELAYEFAVPARYGDSAVRALLAAGEDLGVVPYGTEALGVMRIEKGHVAGNELNGTTTAADLGLAKMVSKKKDFIGRVLAARPGLNEVGRPTLVGIKAANPAARLYAGAHFLERGTQASLENDQGFITSVAFSPTLGFWIGLGFLSRGAARIGERLRAHDPLRNGDIEVEVTSTVAYDPEGSRLRG
jgi:heterotetrameric sarcosine oxidase alpha subunit